MSLIMMSTSRHWDAPDSGAIFMKFLGKSSNGQRFHNKLMNFLIICKLSSPTERQASDRSSQRLIKCRLFYLLLRFLLLRCPNEEVHKSLFVVNSIPSPLLTHIWQKQQQQQTFGIDQAKNVLVSILYALEFINNRSSRTNNFVKTEWSMKNRGQSMYDW